MIAGAVGNAALAAVVPVLIGEAINSVSPDEFNARTLLTYAFWIAISQRLVIKSTMLPILMVETVSREDGYDPSRGGA